MSDMANKKLDLRLTRYEAPGLYLDFYDGNRLDLTLKNLDRITEEFWVDPERLSPEIKSAMEFRRCRHCGLKGTGTFCNALRPVLPLMEIIDSYSSYDNTLAIFKGQDKTLYHISDTTVQRALTYVSNLSLISFCQVGRKFQKYFFGVIPLMESQEIADKLFLNIYWSNRGDEEAVDSVISSLHREITMASQNQLGRLRLICKNDAFINAFVLTHLLADLLNENRDKNLKEKLSELE